MLVHQIVFPSLSRVQSVRYLVKECKLSVEDSWRLLAYGEPVRIPTLIIKHLLGLGCLIEGKDIPRGNN